MKIGLKILHKVPELDKLADKHQDFGALMDAYTDDKIRKRKKFYKAGSFMLVILATAFLSWLYWGYEPVAQNTPMPEAKLPENSTTEVLPVEEKEPEAKEKPRESSQKPLEAKEMRKEPVEQVKQEPQTDIPQAIPEPEEVKEIEIASPEVVTGEFITSDATPTEGLENLYRYLYKNIDLPDSLLETDKSLFLEVEFEVSAKGKIADISFNKALPEALESELRKVFREMPVWTPALEKGDTVASVINLPITFQKRGEK